MKRFLAGVLLAACSLGASAQPWFFNHVTSRIREQTGPTTLSAPVWRTSFFFNDIGQVGYSQVEVTRPDPQPPIALAQDAANPFQWLHLSPTYTALGDLLAEYPVGSYTWRGDGPSGRVNFVTSIFGGDPPFANPLFTNWETWQTVVEGDMVVLEFQNFRPVDPLDEIYLGIIGPDGWFVFGTSLFPSFTSFTVPGSVFQEVGSYTAVLIHRRFFRYEVSRSQFGYVWLDSRTETGFEVVPVPEPASLTALGAGALLLVRRRRRA